MTTSDNTTAGSTDAATDLQRFGLLAEFAWVALGGAAGTLGRYALNRLIGDLAGVPLGILVINISGAFLLGVLLDGLTLRGPDTGVMRRLRLLLGTGVIGGFTTYSLLAADIAGMVLRGELLLGVGYGLVTVVAGVLASWAGVLSIRVLSARRQGE